MYKFLIIDGDSVDREHTTSFITDRFKGDAEVVSAQSGREALSKLERFRPDIVLIDLLLAGLSGIETIREIKGLIAEAVFIVMTKIERFDSVREVLSLGVSQYLIKPVSTKQLGDVLKNAIEAIEQRRMIQNQKLATQEEMANALTLLEKGFVTSMSLPSAPKGDLRSFCELLKFDSAGCRALIFKIEREIAEHIKSEWAKLMCEALKAMWNCVVSTYSDDRVCAFVSNADNAEKLINETQKVCARITESTHRMVTVGIGLICTSVEETCESFSTAEYALHSGKKGSVNLYRPAVVSEIPDYPTAEERGLLEKVSVGDVAACGMYFSEIDRWTVLCPEAMAKARLIELIVLVRHIAREHVGEEKLLSAQKVPIEVLQDMESLFELRYCCRSILMGIATMVQQERECLSNAMIRKVKLFIDERYMHMVRLTDMANYVRISPHYLSRLFKEETGRNVIEYITEVRMSKAGDLIMSSNYSMKEICHMVGYSDPNYFSRAFKNATGMSPLRYREQYSILK